MSVIKNFTTDKLKTECTVVSIYKAADTYVKTIKSEIV